MVKRDSLLVQVLSGTADASVPFDGLRRLLGRLGIDERIRGGHHIFTRAGTRRLVRYRMAGGSDDQ